MQTSFTTHCFDNLKRTASLFRSSPDVRDWSVYGFPHELYDPDRSGERSDWVAKSISQYEDDRQLTLNPTITDRNDNLASLLRTIEEDKLLCRAVERLFADPAQPIEYKIVERNDLCPPAIRRNFSQYPHSEQPQYTVMVANRPHTSSQRADDLTHAFRSYVEDALNDFLHTRGRQSLRMQSEAALKRRPQAEKDHQEIASRLRGQIEFLTREDNQEAEKDEGPFECLRRLNLTPQQQNIMRRTARVFVLQVMRTSSSVLRGADSEIDFPDLPYLHEIQEFREITLDAYLAKAAGRLSRRHPPLEGVIPWISGDLFPEFHTSVISEAKSLDSSLSVPPKAPLAEYYYLVHLMRRLEHIHAPHLQRIAASVALTPEQDSLAPCGQHAAEVEALGSSTAQLAIVPYHAP